MKIVNCKLKVALVHDYLKEYGGAESVLETLSDIFPDAPIYTALYRPSDFGPHRSRLEKKWSHRIHQSFFKYIPFAHKLISPLRLLSPLAFRLLDFKTFDLIISSATGAYFPNALNKASAKLVCYCHTPPRYLYGLPTARNLTNNKLISAIVAPVNHLLRLLDFHYSQNVNQYIANSATTAARIRKFYRRDSVVINPPVALPPLSSKRGAGGDLNYFLTGGRLARAKRYDIAIQACNKLKLPLKIFGRDFAGFQKELEAIAGPTVEFLGEVTQKQKAKLYQGAKAFIFSSDNEDFGIVPVESMAYGCPVIAYRSGGVAETVVEGKTGIFFDRLTPESCATAIKKLQKLLQSSSPAPQKLSGDAAIFSFSQACISRAADFSPDVFTRKIKDLIDS